MIGRVLFDSDRWLVSTGAFGGVKVALKERELIFKASSFERRHLKKTLAFLDRANATFDTLERELLNKELAVFFEMFAEAVVGRGDSRWQVHFQLTPALLAAEIVGKVSKATVSEIELQKKKIADGEDEENEGIIADED